MGNKDYQDLDAGIVMKAMKKAFIPTKTGNQIKYDSDIADNLVTELNKYIKSNDYTQDLRVLEGVRKERKRVNDRLVEAQAQDLRNVAGAAYQYQNPRDKK
jgi:hypothetical protein